jgi:hypothetical protein
MGISVFPAPSGGLTPKLFTYTTPGIATFTFLAVMVLAIL